MTQPTSERTPLLPRNNSEQLYAEQSPYIISHALSRIASVPGVTPIQIEDILISAERPRGDNAIEPGTVFSAKAFGFGLATLLQLKRLKISFESTDLDIYGQWSQNNSTRADVETLNRTIDTAWTLFLSDYRSDQEIDVALWSAFPTDISHRENLRVVDFLKEFEAPVGFFTHPVAEAALLRRWKHGTPRATSLSLIHPFSEDENLFDLHCGTPWNLHCLSLLSELTYVGLLLHYLLYPPDLVSTTSVVYPFHPREICLFIFLFSHLLKPLSSSIILFLITFLAFVLSFPNVPQPGDTSFEVLLWIFACHILKFHLPIPPSPLFLLDLKKILPISICISEIVLRFSNPLIFYTPVFIFSLFLLSYSLDGPLLFISIALMNKSAFSSHLISLAPMETRVAFLIIAFTVVVLILSTIVAWGNPSASSRPHQNGHKDWDRFSGSIGSKARRISFVVCTKYSNPYTFPAPFNLLFLLIISPPTYAARFFDGEPQWIQIATRVLWRITVGPFLLLCSAFAVFVG